VSFTLAAVKVIYQMSHTCTIRYEIVL
jgi:hypothetical protein